MALSHWILPILLFVWTNQRVGSDEADSQPLKWAAQHRFPEEATDQRGTPLYSLTASSTAGRQGPVVLQDFNLLDHLAHFNRERIPERVVHAKGGGAFGYLEVTHNITEYSRAKVFESTGKRVPVLIRFSTTIGQSGAADTLRDGRGFSIKFYTDDGNWDLVGNNLPVFPIRDPILFPSLIRSRKRNPLTHLHNPNSFWDFISLRPEATFHTLMLFSDLGIPDGFRFQNGFGVHTFKLVNRDGKGVYAKFHYSSNQGIRTLSPKAAAGLDGKDPDYAIRDLHNAIESNQFPSWNFGVQVMTFAEAETYRWNPFDVTKLWPAQDFPILPIGRIVLDKNPTDYFTQIEQAGFSPSSMVPGIEPSPDRMLHGRMFAYADAQRYRLGPNYLQLPINRPMPGIPVNTYQKDGFMCSDDNGAGVPNYFPNSFKGPFQDGRKLNESSMPVSGDVSRTDVGREDNYSQADYYWKNEMDAGARDRAVRNLAEDLAGVTDVIQARVVSRVFEPINEEIGTLLRAAIAIQKVKRRA